MTNLQENSIEVWKDVKGYEGYYQVSNTGRVKSLGRVVICKGRFNKTIFEKILKNKVKKTGYHFLALSKGSVIKYYHVHRLVAAAFIPISLGRNEVNHIDGVKSNNHVSNLEWMTHAENNIHALKTGLKVPDPAWYPRGCNHFRSRSVNQYDLNGNFIKSWDCISDAARHFKCSPNGINRVVLNKRGGKTCQGYKWIFKPIYPLHYPVQGSLFDSKLM